MKNRVGDTQEEICAQIGVHLLLIQDFEHLLTFALRVGLRERSEITIDSLTEEDRRTMGTFMRDLRRDASLRDDLDQLLKQVLDDRNLFVHRLRQQPWFDTHTSEGRDQIWKWFEQAQPRLHEAILIFTAFAFDIVQRSGFPEDISKLPWQGDFYREVAERYMPRVGQMIARKHRQGHPSQ